MIRQWFSQNADPTYATVAFFLFLAVFVAASVWVIKKGSQGFREQERLPLNDD